MNKVPDDGGKSRVYNGLIPFLKMLYPAREEWYTDSKLNIQER